MSINIAIADDHPMIIDGLKNMLGHYSQFSISNTYADGERLMNGLALSTPDVLLLDIQLPGKTGDELAPLIIKKYPAVNILVLTNFDNAIYVNAMMQHGVHGYILKTTSADMLVKAIETIAAGSRFIDPAIEEKVKEFNRIKNSGINKALSAREKEVLQYIVNGDTTKQISERLFLSYHTVENYRNRIHVKLDVKNMADLTRKALTLGLVK